jgi:hypothetical protein
MTVSLSQAIERLASRSGEVLREWGPVSVDPLAVRRFREAVGWPGASESTSIPPTILVHLQDDPVDVHHDVRPREVLDSVLTNPVNGGTRYQWMRPIKLGETIFGRMKMHSAFQREGKSGPLAFVVTETLFLDADENTIARMEKTMIYRGVAS